MERVDLVSVALLWCVGFLALSQAINARGHFRIALSWIIAAAIFVIAFFFSSLKAIDLRNLLSTDGPVQTTLQGNPPPPPQAGPPRQPSESVAEPSRPGSTSESAYRSDVRKLLREARSCAETISTFKSEANPDVMGASRYEKDESRARALRNQSAALLRQFRSYNAPDGWNDFHDDLLSTLENLRLSGYEIHAQFSSDADTGSSDHRNLSKKQAQAAIEGITKAEKRLTRD